MSTKTPIANRCGKAYDGVEHEAHDWDDGVFHCYGYSETPGVGSTIPARNSDPATSKAATPPGVRANSQRFHLLAAFALLGDRGGTDEEAMGIAPPVSPTSEYAKRCSELRDGGFIEPTGETHAGASGHQRIVSRITDKGRAKIEELA